MQGSKKRSVGLVLAFVGLQAIPASAGTPVSVFKLMDEVAVAEWQVPAGADCVDQLNVRTTKRKEVFWDAASRTTSEVVTGPEVSVRVERTGSGCASTFALETAPAVPLVGQNAYSLSGTIAAHAESYDVVAAGDVGDKSFDGSLSLDWTGRGQEVIRTPFCFIIPVDETTCIKSRTVVVQRPQVVTGNLSGMLTIGSMSSFVDYTSAPNFSVPAESAFIQKVSSRSTTVETRGTDGCTCPAQ